MDNFVKNLELFLKEKGWSKNKFAKELGCDSSTVSKWLKLKQQPTLEYVIKIVKVLDCTFEELIS